MKEAKILIVDDSLINELNYCYVEPGATNSTDMKDNTVLIRGSKYQTVNKMLSLV